jgi:polyisoprenoid-binding protein YceI
MRRVVLSFVVLLLAAASIPAFHSVTDVSDRPVIVRYRLDPARSRFIVHANRAGLAWFKGHSHRLAVGDFSGTAEVALDAVNPASLQLTVRANSLEETDPVFTAAQKKIIKKEIDELVLEVEKYPEINFASTDVKGKLAAGKLDVKIRGNLTLHGVTKRIVIPATVTVSQDSIRATGEFEVDRKDFGVNATEAFHGFVKVRHHVKFEFDIVGEKL